MAWWGKILGGALGLMAGGPLGALLGGALGHQFDKVSAGNRLGFRFQDQERIQTAFFTATFSVLGYVAKADGRVSESEIAMAEHLIKEMRLDPQQRQAAIRLFNAGKQNDFPLFDVLDEFRTECRRRHTLLQMCLEIQIQGAFADGALDTAERQALQNIAEHLGFPGPMFQRLLDLIQNAARPGAGSRSRQVPINESDIKAAYRTLGVGSDASDSEVKKAYRRLMNQHHPDKLVAQGLPEEMIKLATEKTQTIREAYDRIMATRRK